MYNAFISVIGIIKGDKSTILNYINSTYNDLSSNFSDFEIILINNHFTDNLDSVWESLSLDVKKSILIVNLSIHTYFSSSMREIPKICFV